jgi:hypothetical protein
MSRMLGRGVVATFLALIVPLIATAAAAPAAVVINEVESDGASDYAELFNTGPEPIDIGEYQIDDDNDGNRYAIPNGTILPAGGFYVADVSSQVAFGAPDAARLFAPADPLNPLDSHSWISHAATTYGRCPDGNGEFAVTITPTPGTANECESGGDNCVVPTIAKGSSRKKVKSKLNQANCTLGDVTKRFSSKVKRGKLIRLKEEAGAELAHGAEVAAVFSKGKRPS